MEKRKNVRVIRVIDGDTVLVGVHRGFRGLLRSSQEERIRLYGIDAPESAQKGGGKSTRHLRKIIGSGKKVWLEPSGTDQYGRTIGLIYGREGRANSYNYQMVAAGQAHCYMLDSFDQGRFREAEQKAKKGKKGVWKQKNPTYPWDYRKAHKSGGGHIPWKICLALLAAALLVLAAWRLQGNLGPAPQMPEAVHTAGLPGPMHSPGPMNFSNPMKFPNLPERTGTNGPDSSGTPASWETLRGR